MLEPRLRSPHPRRAGPVVRAPMFAMRNVTGTYAGDIWMCHVPETRADYEAFRLTLDDPDAFEVVELDADGHVIP